MLYHCGLRAEPWGLGPHCFTRQDWEEDQKESPIPLSGFRREYTGVVVGDNRCGASHHALEVILRRMLKVEARPRPCKSRTKA